MAREKNKKNLLILLPYIDLGGGARRVQVYCQYLPLFGWSVSVALYSQKVQRNTETVLGLQTPLIVTPNIQKIVSFARKQKIDAAYAIFDGQYDPYLAKLFSELKKHSVKILTNNVFSYFDERMFALADRVLFQTFYMGLIKFARVFPTEYLLPLHKISYLTNPVHTQYLETLTLPALEREQLRRQLGFTPEQCVVARFGRSDIIKWGDELLEALLALRNDSNIAFLLVGVPRSRRILLKVLCELFPQLKDRVVVLSPTGDDQTLMSLMQVSDVVAHSVNIGEGCSNAINECLYWGKPVITTVTPHCDSGQAEQVVHGKTGYFAQTVEQWVFFIRLLAAQPEKRLLMGKDARAFVLKNIGGAKIAQRFSEILNDVNREEKKTTISEQQYASYQLWYEKLIRQYPVYKAPGIWYKLLRNARRVLNYLEHTYWNE